MDTYKLCVIGDGGVGKSTWRKMLMTNEFEKKYVATLGVEVYPIQVDELRGDCFNLWDCAGQEKFGGLRVGYYVQSHGAIIMCDLTSKLTLKNVEIWARDFRSICPNEPIILVGNKSDIRLQAFSVDQLVKMGKNIGANSVKVISVKDRDSLTSPLIEFKKAIRPQAIHSCL